MNERIENLKAHYDPKVDVLYIRVGKGLVQESEEVDEDVIKGIPHGPSGKPKNRRLAHHKLPREAALPQGLYVDIREIRGHWRL